MSESDSHTRLKVEGQILDEWVSVLESECRKVLEQGRHVCLDLFYVTFVDSRGLAALRKLKSDGLIIVNAPRLIEEAFEGE